MSHDFANMLWLTEKMIRDIGGNPDAMNEFALCAFDQFAFGMEANHVKVVLMHNGMNSGKHTSKEHPEGKAIDFALVARTYPPIIEIMMRAAFCGFTGFGVYYNSKGIYSYHVHTGPRFASWQTRILADGTRKTGALINDPGRL
jgi:hypothetical protein